MVLFTLSDSVVVERARNSRQVVLEEEADDALETAPIVERATAAVSELNPSIVCYIIYSLCLLSITIVLLYFAADSFVDTIDDQTTQRTGRRRIFGR